MRTPSNSYIDEQGWTWWRKPEAAPDIWIRYDEDAYAPSSNIEIKLSQNGEVYKAQRASSQSMHMATNSSFFTGETWYTFDGQRYESFVGLVEAIKAKAKLSEASSDGDI